MKALAAVAVLNAVTKPASRLADGFLDALDVPAPQPFDFTAQLEIAGDRFVLEHAEAVDDGNRPAGPGHDLLRYQIAVGIVRHRQDQRIDALDQRMEERHNAIDKRLRVVEQKAAVAGAVSGSAVSIGIALAIEGVKQWLGRGGAGQ